MGVGGFGGAYLAKKMNITDLPQMVAGFHSLVGLAAVATSVSSYLAHGAADPVALTATFLGALIGTITMTGATLLSHQAWLPCTCHCLDAQSAIDADCHVVSDHTKDLILVHSSSELKYSCMARVGSFVARPCRHSQSHHACTASNAPACNAARHKQSCKQDVLVLYMALDITDSVVKLGPTTLIR